MRTLLLFLQQRISFVRSAAVSFIEENLPDGTWLSLIAFGPNANVLKPLQQLNSRARKGFTNAVPRVTCGGPERKLVHAIREAISVRRDNRRLPPPFSLIWRKG